MNRPSKTRWLGEQRPKPSKLYDVLYPATIILIFLSVPLGLVFVVLSAWLENSFWAKSVLCAVAADLLLFAVCVHAYRKIYV